MNRTERAEAQKLKSNKLKAGIKKLLAEHDSDDIFEALKEASTETQKEYLTDKVVKFLSFHAGMSIVKLKTLKDEMDFRDKMETIFPHMNDRDANLFTAHL